MPSTQHYSPSPNKQLATLLAVALGVALLIILLALTASRRISARRIQQSRTIAILRDSIKGHEMGVYSGLYERRP